MAGKKNKLKTSRPLRRIAVLVDTSTTWGRGVVGGILTFCRLHQNWEVFVEARGQQERMRLPRGWPGHGVIARVSDPEMARELQATRLPVVNVSGIKLAGSARFPQATTDLVTSGKMAAKHFLDRGFQNFAYFSLQGLDYVSLHREAFLEAVIRAGGHMTSMSVKPATGAEPDWRLDLARLGDWLRHLPKPVAILCWNASSAREILYAGHEAGIHIPEEAAILSQADDEILCEASLIPISGITAPAERIGYEASLILDKLMQGRRPSTKPTLLAPQSIVTRQSTQTIALNDPILVKALSFIRQHAVEASLGVPEIARHAGASRRALERRFLQVLKRAPAEEIRRVRLEQAKILLAQTRMSMPEVAAAAGLASQAYLSSSFRRRFGKTPLQYRQENFSTAEIRSPL